MDNYNMEIQYTAMYDNVSDNACRSVYKFSAPCVQRCRVGSWLSFVSVSSNISRLLVELDAPDTTEQVSLEVRLSVSLDSTETSKTQTYSMTVPRSHAGLLCDWCAELNPGRRLEELINELDELNKQHSDETADSAADSD